MKEIVKEHPLRAIILRFDLSKNAPDFETKGLEAYYAMHDSTWQMRTQLSEHHNELIALIDEIAGLEFSLLPIEQELEFMEVVVGVRDPAELPVVEGRFTINPSEVGDTVEAHSNAMKAFYPKVKAAWDWFDKHADFIYEKESWVAEGLHDLIHPIYSRYEEVSVDIVSLDRDQQEFYGAYAEVEQLQKAYFDCGDHAFEDYDRRLKRANETYRRFEVVDKLINERFGGAG